MIQAVCFNYPFCSLVSIFLTKVSQSCCTLKQRSVWCIYLSKIRISYFYIETGLIQLGLEKRIASTPKEAGCWVFNRLAYNSHNLLRNTHKSSIIYWDNRVIFTSHTLHSLSDHDVRENKNKDIYTHTSQQNSFHHPSSFLHFLRLLTTLIHHISPTQAMFWHPGKREHLSCLNRVEILSFSPVVNCYKSYVPNVAFVTVSVQG